MDSVTTITIIAQKIHDGGLDAIHFILAYAGMLIHILMKLAEVFPRPDFSYKNFIRKNLITTIISIIGIPVLLIVATDTSLHELLPVNYITAVLCGWQTQSLFKTIFELAGRKRGLNLNGAGGAMDIN
jgi:hypothetical protein